MVEVRKFVDVEVRKFVDVEHSLVIHKLEEPHKLLNLEVLNHKVPRYFVPFADLCKLIP